MSKFLIFCETLSSYNNKYSTAEYRIDDDEHKVIYCGMHEHTSKNQAFLYAAIVGCPMFSYDEVINYIMHKDDDMRYLVGNDIKNFTNILDK